MTKFKNRFLNYVALIGAIILYVSLETYNMGQNLQEFLLFLILICGLILFINNIICLKSSSSKLISILLICFGAIIVLYFGFILYLVLALQNAIF